MRLCDLTGKRKVANKIKPKDVDLETEDEMSPWDGNPMPRKFRKKNLGEQRAAEEKKRRGKPEYELEE